MRHCVMYDRRMVRLLSKENAWILLEKGININRDVQQRKAHSSEE